MNSKSIKNEAKASLKGRWLKACFILLCYLIAKKVIHFISSIGNFSTLNLLELALDIPFSFGLAISFIKLKRNKDVSPITFFKDTFSDNFVRAWCVEGRILLKLIVPIILIVISGFFIGPYLFKIIGFIIDFLADKPFQFSTIDPTAHMLLLVGFDLFIVFTIYAIIFYIITSKYALSFFIAYDEPDLSAKDVVQKSEDMMMGNRFKYFKLILSFIGWGLLYLLIISGIIFCTSTSISDIVTNISGYNVVRDTLPNILYYVCYIPIYVGAIFLGSYFRMSKVCFYESLKSSDVILGDDVS